MCAVISLNVPDDPLCLESPPDGSLHQSIAELSQLNTAHTEVNSSCSKHRGLCWDKKHQSWRTRIFYAGKQRHIGRFKDALVAARAYDRAAYFLYGEKAILNFSMEEAAADQGDVPLFIRQAKEQAEATATLAAAEVGSVQLSHGLTNQQVSLSAGAGVVWQQQHQQHQQQSSLAGFSGLQVQLLNQGYAQMPGWQQVLHNLPLQQQQQQLYLLDSVSNTSCQGVPMQQLQMLQQQPQAQLPHSVSWNASASAPAAATAAQGTYTLLGSNSAPMYTLSEACMPLGSNSSSFIPGSISSHGGNSLRSSSSSSQAALPAGLLLSSLSAANASTAGDSMLLSATLSAAVPAGMQQQQVGYGAQGCGSERMLLRQTLERQLQKQQHMAPASPPQPILQVPVSQAPYIQEGPTTTWQQVLSPGMLMPQSLAAQQQQLPQGAGNVQILHMPPMPMHTQHIRSLQQSQQQQQLHVSAGQVDISPAASAGVYKSELVLQQGSSTQQQLQGIANGISQGFVQQALVKQEFGLMGSGQSQGLAHSGQQQAHAVPVTVGALTSMLQNGALQL